MKSNLAVLGFGTGFGFLIAWAHLADPDVIHAMLRLAEIDVFLLMGSAIAVASIGVRVLRSGRVKTVIGGAPVAWKTLRPTRDHVIGSVCFGLGWSLTNSCPGPVAVQLGSGRLMALCTAAGLVAGIAVRDAMRARDGNAPAPAPVQGDLAPGL